LAVQKPPRQLGRVDHVLRDSAFVQIDRLIEDHEIAGRAFAGGVGRIEEGAIVTHVIK
jgi:hypothetical protein